MVTVKYTRTGEADISDSNFRGQVPRKGGKFLGSKCHQCSDRASHVGNLLGVHNMTRRLSMQRTLPSPAAVGTHQHIGSILYRVLLHCGASRFFTLEMFLEFFSAAENFNQHFTRVF